MKFGCLCWGRQLPDCYSHTPVQVGSPLRRGRRQLECVAELAPDCHRHRNVASYGEKMPKPIKIIIAGAIGFAAILAVVVIVSSMITRIPDVLPDRVRLPQQALTPEEITVTAAPQADGTLHVSERLIFDAPDGADRPILWHLGGESIGWPAGDGDVPRYAVMPRASEVSARELDTTEKSTKNDPVEIAQLSVTRDDSDVDDLFYDDVGYEFANPHPPGENVMWTKGRHVVDVSYILDDVYLNVEGHELFVLPLQFPSGSNEAPSIRTLSLEAGGPIRCLPDNMEFEPDADCSGLDKHRFAEGGTRLTWQEDMTSSIGAIGFAAPDTLQTEPIPVYEHRRN